MNPRLASVLGDMLGTIPRRAALELRSRLEAIRCSIPLATLEAIPIERRAVADALEQHFGERYEYEDWERSLLKIWVKS